MHDRSLQGGTRMCGIAGVIGTKMPLQLTLKMLEYVEPRGNGEGAGIAFADQNNIEAHRIVGGPDLLIRTLPFTMTRRANCAIAHHRYGTSGASEDTLNVQPFVRSANGFRFALAHNGSIPKDGEIRKQLPNLPEFEASSDSEILGLLIAQQKTKDFLKAVITALKTLNDMTSNDAAYSLLIMSPDMIIAACDPRKYRPLAIGRIGNGWGFASEDSALRAVGAEDIQEIGGGSVVCVRNGELSRHLLSTPQCGTQHCVVETLYLSQRYSHIFGYEHSVADHRSAVGAKLSQHYTPPDEERADTLVIPVPESAIPLAEGYAEATGLPLVRAILKFGSAKRSFIQPNQKQREKELLFKFCFLAHLIAGKHVVLVDDSLIRGTTMKYLAGKLMECGAKSIVILSGLPQVTRSCYRGVYIREYEGNEPRLISLIHSGDTFSMAQELGVRAIFFSEREDMHVIAEISTLCLDCLKG